MATYEQLLLQADCEGVVLSEPALGTLRVEGHPGEELLKALGLNKTGVLSELWRRGHWGKDYAKDWRRHCLEEWREFQPVSYRMDPREDLTQDHTAWYCILQVAQGGALGLLHGIRALGATLVREGDKWRLSHGQIDEQEYDELRAQVLMRERRPITRALDALSEWRHWHELLTGSDWRPVLEPEDIETSELSRLWFEGKEGRLISIT